MSGGARRLRFELAEDDHVLLWIEDKKHILGPKVDVCSEMERFLVESSFTFEQRFLGMTIEEWDGRWTFAGPLNGKFTNLSLASVGLYRAILDGEVMYIGKANEYKNRGFRKRLSDYTRADDGGRDTRGGRLMFEHRDRLMIDVLITGEDAAAATAAVQMEYLFIAKYNPPWNLIGRPNSAPVALDSSSDSHTAEGHTQIKTVEVQLKNTQSNEPKDSTRKKLPRKK